MAVIRATFFFTVTEHGWSESFYKDGTDAASVIDAAVALSSRRSGCLSSNFSFPHIRVSATGPPRDGQFRTYSAQESIGRFRESAAAPVSQYFDAVNIRASTTGGTSWRNFLIRGIGSGVANADGSLNLANPWFAACQTFLNALASAGWGLLHYTPQAPMVATAISPRGVKGLRITVAARDGALVVGSVVRLSAWDGVAYVNGNWRVRALVDPNGFDLYPKRRVPILSAAPTFGAAARLVPSVLTFTTFAFVSGTKRSTGRPSYVPRGRRSSLQA